MFWKGFQCAKNGTEIVASVKNGAKITSGGGFSTLASRPAWQAAAVEAYPTWVVNGKTLTGVQTLAALEAALGTSPSAATRAADSILISPENVKRRRTAPAEEPCDDCAVDAKPSVT